MQPKSWIPYVLVGIASAAPQEASATPSATAACEPHTDHWHCPSGVPQPSLQPDGKPNPKYSGAAEASETPSATTSGAAATGTCEPHTDHWHCPSGVPQPSLQPDGKPNPKYKGGDDEDHGDDHDDHDHDHDSGSGSKECTPHGDHWHCPSGVAEPDHPPPTTTAGAPAETSGTAAATPSPTTGGSSSLRASLSVAVAVAGTVVFGALLL